MSIKLNTTLACSTLILLMMCGTGYATTAHDDHLESLGTVVVHNRQLGATSEKSAVGSEIIVKITSDMASLSAADKTPPKAEARGNTASDNPNNSLIDKEFDVDIERVALEDVGPKTSTVTTVSKWLEARANGHYANEPHTGDCSHEEAAFIQDEGMVMGGGWCDLCGCWMRHGCDSNGNCTIGHEQVCGSGNCSLHPYNSCRNSG